MARTEFEEHQLRLENDFTKRNLFIALMRRRSKFVNMGIVRVSVNSAVNGASSTDTDSQFVIDLGQTLPSFHLITLYLTHRDGRESYILLDGWQEENNRQSGRASINTFVARIEEQLEILVRNEEIRNNQLQTPDNSTDLGVGAGISALEVFLSGPNDDLEIKRKTFAEAINQLLQEAAKILFEHNIIDISHLYQILQVLIKPTFLRNANVEYKNYNPKDSRTRVGEIVTFGSKNYLTYNVWVEWIDGEWIIAANNHSNSKYFTNW